MQKTGTIQIIYPVIPSQFDEVRKLIRTFVTWHHERHPEDSAFTDGYFDEKALEAELSSLDLKYAKPRNSLLLALYDGQAAGCVALREIDAQACEMKRMFVYEKFHGKGVGRALAKAIIQEAKAIGYSSMKLDTSFRQVEAQGLYESLGFRRINPYYELPDKLRSWLVFMELQLKNFEDLE